MTVMNSVGLLRIQVRRGINLAVRDHVSHTSDPYVVISHAGQKVRTSVVPKNCQPVWNENLTLPLKDPNVPITLRVFDKDTFTEDDEMGDADVNIKPFLECLKMGLRELPDGTKVDRVQPAKNNCLSKESAIIWNRGKMAQQMYLKLRNVECGEIEIQIEWLDFPGLKSPVEFY
ncbi:OLC1v1032080C1 [Oldenlandia corymbosa var. corymbosa]|uniref:OLC1v1032080C1 n=1 Tax=Oldenlandia corymbosa var. corymbosa TaxID=529605 RepID=A0AAV1CKY9_OLDCO|nr:OLC1v1032080C1 [Oldenlandia corymbosa var. corymbosa]